MNARTKTIGVLSMFVLSMGCLLGTTAAGTGLDPAGITPSGPFDPYQGILQSFLAEAGNLEGFSKAPINDTNVYYKSRNLTGSRSFPVAFNESGTHQQSVASIEAFFASWYNNYTLLNATLQSYAGASFEFGGSSSGWTEQAWKEGVAVAWHVIESAYQETPATNATFTTFLAAIETKFAATNPVAHGLPAFRVGTTWANATPGEVYAVMNAVVEPRGSFWTSQFMFRDQNIVPMITGTTVRDIIEHALDVMTPAKDELAGHTMVNVTYNLDVDVDVTITVDDKAVFLLWDQDDSVRRFIEAITPPVQRPDTKLFTGDEMLYLVHFTKVQRTVTGDVSGAVSWTYEDASPASAFKEALRVVTRRPQAAQLIARAAGIPVQLFRAMFYHDVNIAGGSRTATDTSFSMAQLKVNQADFTYRLGQGIQPSAVDVWYAEHKMVGLFAYEDVNGNGLQDLSIEGNAPFLYPVSNEARYKYAIQAVDAIQVKTPAVVGDQLVFGIAFNGVQGAFVPFDISEDATILNGTIQDVLPSNVSTIAFDFRFGVNVTGRSSAMKVDYIFGNFTANDTADPALGGLSLSMITLFNAFRFQYGSRLRTNTRFGEDTGADINLGSNETRAIGRVRFASGTSLANRVFEMDLTSIPYQLAGTDHVATAQFIPVRAGHVAWGRATPVGNMTRVEGLAVTHVVMLYSVNFPTWGGQAIVHDPVFTTFIPLGGPSGIWWIIGIAIGGIAALVIVLGVVARRKRASPYPVPAARAGGAKATTGAGVSSKLLASFLFSGEITSDEVNPLRKVAYMDGIFQFFSALVTTVTMARDEGASTWHVLDWSVLDSKHRDPGLVVREVLLRPAFASSDHVPQSISSGKGYVYEITRAHEGHGTMFVLDVFTRDAGGPAARHAFISTAPLDPAITGVVAGQLAGWLRDRAGGGANIDKPAGALTIALTIERYLPVHVALPRIVAPAAVSSFKRAVAGDELARLGDLDEIDADIASLGIDRAASVATRIGNLEREMDRINDGELRGE